MTNLSSKDEGKVKCGETRREEQVIIYLAEKLKKCSISALVFIEVIFVTSLHSIKQMVRKAVQNRTLFSDARIAQTILEGTDKRQRNKKFSCYSEIKTVPHCYVNN